MSSFICPACKEINEQHRNYCKSCGNWLLSTNYPSKPIKGNTVSKPKWFLIVQISLIGLFAFLAAIVILGSTNAGSSVYGILIGLGLLGLVTTFISWIIALCVNQARILKKQLLLFPVLHITLIVFGASFVNQPHLVQPTSASSTVVPTLEDYKAGSVSPNPRDLARTADTDFKGKKVHLIGTIVQVVGKEGDELRLNLKEKVVPGTFKEPITVFIFRKDKAGTLLNGDELELWGTVLGTQTYKAWTGVELTIPAVQSDYILLQEKNKK